MIRYFIRIVLELLWVDWQYVGSFEGEKINMVEDMFDTYSSEEYHRIQIHLFESRWGTRHARIVVCRGGPIAIFNWQHYSRIRKSEIWQTKVYPWLRGRRIKNIPTYQKVKGGKWDFKKLLRGETPLVLNDDEA